MSITTRITAEQLFAMPASDLRTELVRGEIIRMNPAGGEHGAIIGELTCLLGQHVRAHKLGRIFGAETGFLIARDPDTVRAPDVAFVRQSRIATIGIPQFFFPGPPDLAVEVLSPGDRTAEVEAKTHDWLEHGTVVVWIVDPQQQTVAVHREQQEPEFYTSSDVLTYDDLLAGLRLPVAEIFPTA